MHQCKYCICFRADPNGSASCLIDRQHVFDKGANSEACEAFVYDTTLDRKKEAMEQKEGQLEASPVYHAEDLDTFNKLHAKERVKEACEELQKAIDEHKQEQQHKEEREATLATLSVLPRSGMRGNVLLDAYKIINGERRDSYGEAENSFQAIAKLWSAYLATKFGCEDMDINEQDVALLMTLFKLGRIAAHYSVEDSFKDAAGYLGLASEMGGNPCA